MQISQSNTGTADGFSSFNTDPIFPPNGGAANDSTPKGDQSGSQLNFDQKVKNSPINLLIELPTLPGMGGSESQNSLPAAPQGIGMQAPGPMSVSSPNQAPGPMQVPGSGMSPPLSNPALNAQQPLQDKSLSGGLMGSIEDMLVEFLNKLQNLLKMVSGNKDSTPPSSAIQSAPQNIVANSSVPMDTPNIRLANVGGAGAASTAKDGDTSLKTDDKDLQKLVDRFGGDYQQASKETGVPAKLLASVTMQESGGNTGATSTNPGNGKTDTGMNQINPDTYAGMRKEHPDKLGANMSDPKNQIMCTALMLKEGKEKYGNYDAALRAYNSGDDQVNMKDLSKVTIGDPNYVKEVNEWMSKFK